jgi:hypothetical protein
MNSIATVAPEFNEGTLTLGSEFWYCTDHSTKNRAGHDCAFCVQESMTDAEFDRWLTEQSV